jgi:hypothetical protein
MALPTWKYFRRILQKKRSLQEKAMFVFKTKQYQSRLLEPGSKPLFREEESFIDYQNALARSYGVCTGLP